MLSEWSIPGRPLHDVSTWPDGRLLELAEGRASYDGHDVASMAHELLKFRRQAEETATHVTTASRQTDGR